MDTVFDTKPPATCFTDLEVQVLKYYGGKFEFVQFLESERDRNYLLLWTRETESEQASDKKCQKVILKVSNRSDPKGLLSLQTDAMAYCFEKGCRVQEIFGAQVQNATSQSVVVDGKNSQVSPPGDAKVDDSMTGDAGTANFTSQTVKNQLVVLQLGDGNAYLARLVSYAKGSVLSALGNGKELSLQERAWAMTGRELGKVSKCLREFYVEELRKQESEGGADRFAAKYLDPAFEWNLKNARSVVGKYLKYFDANIPEGASATSAAEALRARKKARLLGLLAVNEEKYFSNEDSASRQVLLAPLTLTHHDPNDNNVVFDFKNDEGELQITILDFGDMGISYFFADAAIGRAYAPSEACADGFVLGWMETADALGCLGPTAAAGDMQALLEDVIRDWAAMRQITSVAISNFQAANDPDNEYLQCSAASLWKQLGVDTRPETMAETSVE